MKKLFVLVTIWILFSSGLYTQWVPDVRLTNNTSISYTSLNRPCIAASGDVLHIVWHDNRDGNTEVYYKRSTDAGTTWGSDIRLTNNSANSEFPTIAVLGLNVYVVWHDGRDTTNEIYFNKSTDAGITWGADTRITFAPGASNFPVIAVSGSAMHVAWHDYRNSSEPDIYYKQSTDAGASWSADVRMTVSAGVRGFPQLTISGLTVHLIWQDNRHGQGEIYYARSSNSGVNWSTEVRLTIDGGISAYPTVSSSGSTVHLSWWDSRSSGNEIYYKKTTDDGLNWGTDTKLTNSVSSAYDPFIYASGTLVHIVWIDSRDGNFEIYYKGSSDAGANWSNDYRITNSSGTSECNSMIVNGPKVHVLWQDTRDGNYEIYYKQNPIGNTLTAVDSVIPNKNKVNVLLNSDMKAYFNQNMNASTMDSSSVIFFGSMTGRKQGILTYNSGEKSVSINPQYNFKYGELISTTLRSSIKTGTDNFITPFVWSFTSQANPSNMVFNEISNIAVGTNPYSVASGDFDNDVDIDLAVANSAGSISIIINNGNGTFTKQDPDIVSGDTRRVITGDFDNDGDMDLAACIGSLSSVKILTNNGNAVFTISSTVPSGYCHDLTTADFNGDGYLDIATSGWTDNKIGILLNNRSGSFTLSSIITTGSGVYEVVAGDFDADGFIDIAAPNYYDDNCSIYRNNGTGNFTALSSVGVGSSPQGITVGDLDSDGDLDLSVTNSGSNSLNILKNNGNGSFTSTAAIGIFANSFGINCADLDGDGDLELAVCAGNTVSLYRNDGTGNFTFSSYAGRTGIPVARTTIADFNNDGVLDIATADINANKTRIIVSLVPPQLLSPANNSTGNLNALSFSWNKPLGAANYRFQLATDSLFSSIIVNDSTLIGLDSLKNVSGLSPLTWYYWRMNSKSANGSSLWSDVWKFKTQGAPTQVVLNAPANNAINQPVNINFVWHIAIDQFLSRAGTNKEINSNGSDNVSKYWFELSTDSLFSNVINIDSTLGDTTNVVNGLINLTNYYWRVRAKNETGWGAYSAWYKFTTIISAPSAPVPINPANGSTGQNVSLTLVWNKIPTADSYRLQVSSDSLFTGLIINDSTLTDTTRLISGLNPLSFYWWRVNAKNIGGTGSYSAMWKFKTIGYPAIVTLINPPNNASNQPISVNFRWSRAFEQMSPFEKTDKQFRIDGGIDAISLYCFDMVTDTVSMANLLRDTTLTDTTKTVGSLGYLTNYYWRVKAKGQIGWGNYSSWNKFTTIISAPATPVLVSPPNGAIGQNISLTLVWNKVLTAVNYRVQLATDSLFTNLIANDSTLTDSTKLISGLNPLTYYWWKVSATNMGGTSGYCSAYKFKTMGAPTQVILFTPLNNAANQPVNLTCVWRKSTDLLAPWVKNTGLNADENESISNYWFDMVTDTVSMANLLRDTTLTDSSKAVSGLSYLTSYYWRVKAKNQIGWGSYSVWFKFTTIPLPPALVNLTVIPGGFFNSGTNQLYMKDTIRVYLVDSVTCLAVDSSMGVLDSVNFSMPLSFGNAATGNYYLLVYHRNHLGVATRFKQSVVRGSTVSYDFTTDSAKAFGFNMVKLSISPVRWGMIPGDANRDGFIDAIDQFTWVAQNGLDGYLAADFNGDGFVDAIDQAIWVTFNGLSSFLPCGFTLEQGTQKLIQNAPDYDAKKGRKIMNDRKIPDKK